jgi:RsiW-degrading membrane proteinase PrsW (M82 family)
MTNPLLLLALAIAPAAVLLKYVLIKDKYKREPLLLVAKTFLLGMLSTVAAIVLELILNIPIPFLREFVSVALIEESLKFTVVMYAAYRSPHFNEVMDGIVYGVAASLGFATVENILYVFVGGAGTAILRAFLSVPAHAAYGGIMGYYLGLAKQSRLQNPGREKRLMAEGLLFAVGLHGAYDASLENLGLIGVILAIAIAIISWLIFLHLMRDALSKQPWYETGEAPAIWPRFCTNCGTKVVPNTRFCANCGQNLRQPS